MVRIVDKVMGVPLVNPFGNFLCGAYRTEDPSSGNMAEHMLLYKSIESSPLPVRINSACFTGDLFGCNRCDCNWQMIAAIRHIATHGSGLIIYHLHHEGRANGILAKLRTHMFADNHDMPSGIAYERCGAKPDARVFESSVLILKDLDISIVELLSNNHNKVTALEKNDIRVVQRISVRSDDPTLSKFYERKREEFGHDV